MELHIIISKKKSLTIDLANSAYTYRMQHYASFHLVFHCLQKHSFMGLGQKREQLTHQNSLIESGIEGFSINLNLLGFLILFYCGLRTI